MADRGLHGANIDLSRVLPQGMARGGESLVEALLNAGNKLRYGVSEEDRMDMVNKLSAPGVREFAFKDVGEEGQPGFHQAFDPAAAERFTSAYLFGKKWDPNSAGLRDVIHGISGRGREGLNAIGFPGVGEERPELAAAERGGMERGAAADGSTQSLVDILMRKMAR